MSRVIDYKVVGARTTSELEDVVKRNLLGGWQPFGGVNEVVWIDPSEFASERLNQWLTQAMVRYES